MKHLKSSCIVGSTLGISGMFFVLTASPAAAAPDGKMIFESTCSVCHSVMPPPKSAPPIVPIASRYRQRFATKSKGVEHMVSFLKSPSKEKMVADPQAMERFGLMPAMQLSDAELNTVAGWVWDQGSAGGWGPGSGAGKGQGAGNGIRKP
ncbi:MAG: cytochrome c [Chlorobiaceae bacterium]|nr:cytochrome c [Chlorobiaceae bacterium]